jgi:hypothetical protein
MAMIYYVKDGPRPGNSGPGYKVSLEDLETKLGNQRIKYLGLNPPEINKDKPSIYPCRVVVEIDSNDSKGRLFDKIGFYLILELTPEKAHKQIEIILR